MIVEIFGPGEKDYLEKLNKIINDMALEKRVIITNKTYSIEEQIKKLDQSKIFVLPSKSEGMPQALIEAMAKNKIVIASDNLASREIIIDGKNGFLFENGNSRDLADKINLIIDMDKSKINKIKMNAKRFVEKFSWNKIINKLENAMKK